VVTSPRGRDQPLLRNPLSLPQVKKLVYVYLVRYAEEQQDLALLSISTFQRGLKVRGLQAPPWAGPHWGRVGGVGSGSGPFLHVKVGRVRVRAQPGPQGVEARLRGAGEVKWEGRACVSPPLRSLWSWLCLSLQL
jgi:hypothetical protein